MRRRSNGQRTVPRLRPTVGRDAGSSRGDPAQWRTVTALLPTVAAAIGTFAVTNVDDIVVLTALFATTSRGGASRRQVVVGQYVGMTVIVAVSAVAARGLFAVPERYVGLVGLIPIALGVLGLRRAWWGTRSDDAAASAVPVRGILGVAGITLANGADNVSVYTPLFRQTGFGALGVFALVSLVLVAVWCVAGSQLAGRRPVIAVVDSVGHWLVPLVFILIGAVIVLSSGLIA